MKNYPIFSKIFLSIIFISSILSCIDPFEINYNLNKSVLIVDGVLSDEIGEQTIIIKQSIPNSNSNSSAISPLEKATVEIVVNGTEKIPFTESTINPGYYIGPAAFKAELNKTYQLFITNSSGKKFQSKIEKLKKGVEVKTAYQKLVVVGDPFDKNYKAFHSIYLDTEDPVGKGDNYMWTWRLFENQAVCKSCAEQELYYLNPYPGDCRRSTSALLRNIRYDYLCNGSCWEILHSTAVNVMSDDFSDGKTITGRLIAEVPIYQLNKGALIEIHQQTINTDVYKYMKILIDQNQNSGGLADTPPVALVGNIVNSNDNSELVAGYFRVVDESIFRYWIDRTNFDGKEIFPIGLLGGRTISTEPSGMDTTRPPFAPCVEGYTKTKIKPIGWQD